MYLQCILGSTIGRLGPLLQDYRRPASGSALWQWTAMVRCFRPHRTYRRSRRRSAQGHPAGCCTRGDARERPAACCVPAPSLAHLLLVVVLVDVTGDLPVQRRSTRATCGVSIPDSTGSRRGCGCILVSAAEPRGSEHAGVVSDAVHLALTAKETSQRLRGAQGSKWWPSKCTAVVLQHTGGCDKVDVRSTRRIESHTATGAVATHPP